MLISNIAVVFGAILLATSGFFIGGEIFQSKSFQNGTLFASLLPEDTDTFGIFIEEIPLRGKAAIAIPSYKTPVTPPKIAAAKPNTTPVRLRQLADGELPQTVRQTVQEYTAAQAEEPESPAIVAAATQPAPKKLEPVFCSPSNAPPSQNPVVMNEIAWMGDAESAQHEWIELKNISSAVIPVGGWQIFDKSRSIKIVLENAVLSAGNFFIAARQKSGSEWMTTANASFSGTLNNSDEELVLFDAECRVIDRVVANSGWPAGDNKTKATMERDVYASWHTSGVIGGTPGFENSVPEVHVALEEEESETAPENSNSAEPTANSSAGPIGSNANPPPPPPEQVPPPPTGPQLVLISEIMAGIDGNSDYDFVELYNNSDDIVDLTGWTLKKKSSTGSESSLVSATGNYALSGKSIAPHGYFLLARAGGYDGVIAADSLWPASYLIAYKDNAVVVYNASGEKIDETTWSDITGYSWVRQGWDVSAFAIAEIPTPQNSQTP